jgi:hypothetical protein
MSNPVPEKARREHAAVVEYENIAFTHQIREIVEMTMRDRFVGSIHDQQPRVVARLDRCLSDKLRGQFVVEIACFHEDIIYVRNVVCRMTLHTIRQIVAYYAKPMTLPVFVSTSTCLKAGLEPVPGMRLISPETGQMNLAPV